MIDDTMGNWDMKEIGTKCSVYKKAHYYGMAG